jgi:hypothetical protein
MVSRQFDPGFVVLPKPVYDYERLIRWKRDGRRLIVLETEGNPQGWEFEMHIRISPDLYLFWNEAMAARYRPQLSESQTTVAVAGFPRSDFLHPRLARVFPDRRTGPRPAHAHHRDQRPRLALLRRPGPAEKKTACAESREDRRVSGHCRQHARPAGSDRGAGHTACGRCAAHQHRAQTASARERRVLGGLPQIAERPERRAESSARRSITCS